jgi:hypothetical protein
MIAGHLIINSALEIGAQYSYIKDDEFYCLKKTEHSDTTSLGTFCEVIKTDCAPKMNSLIKANQGGN